MEKNSNILFLPLFQLALHQKFYSNRQQNHQLNCSKKIIINWCFQIALIHLKAINYETICRPFSLNIQ